MFVSRGTPSAGRRRRHPPVIGLLGGIGSGKSRVAAILERAGAWRIDADRAAHDVLALPAMRARLKRRFGPDVLDAKGNLDRTALARRVFSDPSERRAIEAMIHPPVRRLLRLEMKKARARGVPGIVLDVPLLVESGLHRWCDVLVFVDASAAVREARVRSTRGWPPGERRRRERQQLPLKAKRAMADIQVNNPSGLGPLTRQVRRLAQTLFSR